MRTYELLADLPLTIEGYELEGRERAFPSVGMTRVTVTYHLQGAGEEGLGEDVTYSEDDQRAQLDRGPDLPLAGEWTLESFSRHLDGIDLFPTSPSVFPAQLDYRRWAIESAALDLALRQGGRPLHEVLGREPRPVTFVVSLRLGEPPSLAPVMDRLESYPWLRFKLDATPSWDDAFLTALAETGAVASFDFKGAYKGTPVDVPTDPDLYRSVAEAFPEALLEDPDLDPPEADAALRPHRDRITWDAPIHGVDDVLALRFPPRTLNVKPSRYGTLARLFDFYDHCEAEGITLYGGGQSELGVGRGQLHVLASLFHPDMPSDIAPSGYDHDDFPRDGLEPSPLEPRPEPTGFRRRA